MKTKINSIIIVLMVLTLSSCKTTFYQVYRATPTDRSMAHKDALVYEDENCEVTYNLWSYGGNMGFSFFNKTEENIYLNFDECFFVNNGVASDYYLDREFTQSSNVRSRSSRSVGTSKSIAGFNFLGLFQTNSVEAGVSESVMSSSGYLDKSVRIFVIISDGLRYECGKELHDLINGEARYTSSFEYQVTGLPSYTQLGMASLTGRKMTSFSPLRRWR